MHDRPAADWPAPRRRPATYPGAAPRHPYLLVGDRVQPLRVRREGGRVHVTTVDGVPVDDVLRRHGVAPLAERVPTVAYGANRSPDSLALKFVHHGPAGSTAAAVPAVVPVLAVTVADVDAVGATLSSQGYVFADVVDSPGTRLAALLPLLDHRQLAAIHDSEGVGATYDCAWLTGLDLATTDAAGDAAGGAGGTAGTLGAMAYVGRHPVFRDPDAEQPLAFAAVPAERRRYPAFHQVDLLARVVAATGTATRLAPLVGHGDEVRGIRSDAVAADLIRLLGGQWWYRHHSDDRPLAAAGEARRIVREAMAASPWPRPPDSPLTRTVLTPAEAYAPPPSRHLGRLLPLP